DYCALHPFPTRRSSDLRPIVNLLPLEEGERINAVLPIKEFDEQHYVFMATSHGTVKKTPLKDFSRPRSSGIIAIDLRAGDALVRSEEHTSELQSREISY